jgi:hypothetical protein
MLRKPRPRRMEDLLNKVFSTFLHFSIDNLFKMCYESNKLGLLRGRPYAKRSEKQLDLLQNFSWRAGIRKREECPFLALTL